MTDNQFGSRDIASLISRSANRTPSLAKIPSYARWQRRPPPRPPARQKHTKTRLPFLSSSSSSSSSSFHGQALDLPRDLRSLPKHARQLVRFARDRATHIARARARACDQRTELAKHASSFKRQMAAPPAENTR